MLIFKSADFMSAYMSVELKLCNTKDIVFCSQIIHICRILMYSIIVDKFNIYLNK